MESEWGAQNQYTWTNPKYDEKGKDDNNTHNFCISRAP